MIDYMNTHDCDILRIIHDRPALTQRELSDVSEKSLGSVNKSINSLKKHGYINNDCTLTKKAELIFSETRPRRAIILAAGFGMRMVPINTLTSKAFLKVKGEYLIERQIKQLKEVGINEIHIIVGFMKEQFEYLIEEFGVDLIVNSQYATKGNLHSLRLASDLLENAYVIPCDIWCRKNPFNSTELYSWYAVNDSSDEESEVRVNKKSDLVKKMRNEPGNHMIGIAYLTGQASKNVRDNLIRLDSNREYEDCFWECALYDDDRMFVAANVINYKDATEINTYEQLRELDSSSEQLKSDAISAIVSTFNIKTEEITNISVLKKGMTNRSFLFQCNKKKYIMRIPGEGTDALINRKEEAAVYNLIYDKGLCDNILYLNPVNGYKITEYIEGARVCNPDDLHDIENCMDLLRKFHKMELTVDHEFDIFEKIDFYESLWNGTPSVYRDYKQTKKNVLSLRRYIKKHAGKKVLTHIDAVPDNFLFFNNSSGNEELKLIDWEYAGMQDPHVDVAMFCVYAMYDKQKCDRLIDVYFEGHCPEDVRTKIYCYIAACGLLWSNWCEYKQKLGVEFGEYNLRQYRFAKEFYSYAIKRIDGDVIE